MPSSRMPARHCFQNAQMISAKGIRSSVATKATAELQLSSQELDSEYLNLPKGYHWYETMIVMSSLLNDEDRDKELAKFEAMLNKEECLHINALVRTRNRLAYPLKGTNWEATFVLYTYAARRQTARTVQLVLSRPESGSEGIILRHITLCKN